MDPYDQLGVAAHQILRLREELRIAVERKNAALVAIHQGGVAKSHVAQNACARLQSHGFTVDQISRLALSPSSVRLILDMHESRGRWRA